MTQEKTLFIIEGYRIWAYSEAEAYEHLQIIKNI
jgi:hypothetical protein